MRAGRLHAWRVRRISHDARTPESLARRDRRTLVHKLFEAVVGLDDGVEPTLDVPGEADETLAVLELGGLLARLAVARVLSDAEEEGF